MTSPTDIDSLSHADLLAAHKRLLGIVNRPLIKDFIAAVVNEAAHQRDRWGAEHGASKNPEDWFWNVGYLSGKALAAFKAGDRDKALHHTVSSAALLAHWHEHISNTKDPTL
ncbi:hypothetical protein COB52_00030 [Candidatus Kaiserbacteria bacterium]|nr:MAG: hypothetical protein COB52_00030 [Candidatus Kaiserbacteria bacterium]